MRNTASDDLYDNVEDGYEACILPKVTSFISTEYLWPTIAYLSTHKRLKKKITIQKVHFQMSKHGNP